MSYKRIEALLEIYPYAIIGGSGVENWLEKTGWKTLDDVGVPEDFNELDYSPFPHFLASIGFTQRGCRLKCGFCVVPKKEGKNKSIKTIFDIWRGEGYPKHIHLLDNDFFGQEAWKDRCREIITWNYKVCFSQGINIRLFTSDQAEWLAMMDYRDDQFKQKRIYTAWDNLGQEKVFVEGVERLLKVGIKPGHIMAYMLIGYAKNETMEDIFKRFNRMKELGIIPFPMIYAAPGVEKDPELRRFARWVIRRYHQFIPYEDFETEGWRKELIKPAPMPLFKETLDAEN